MPGPDTFDQLLAAAWNSIEFPVTKMRMSIAHDLVEHKYYGVDGARVESVGLAPRRFSFSAPLFNGISPGKAEKWAALYPNQLRILLVDFQKKTKGLLQHPEFGIIVCKAERFDMDWDAARRGGVDAALSFV
jgi:prophage DNA circulation protein